MGKRFDVKDGPLKGDQLHLDLSAGQLVTLNTDSGRKAVYKARIFGENLLGDPELAVDVYELRFDGYLPH